MKHISIYLFLICLTFACKDGSDLSQAQLDDLCSVKTDVIEGDIVGMIPINCPFTEGKNYLVKSYSDWEEALASCNGNIPSVDFIKYDLLGITAGLTGCQQYYYQNVTRNNTHNEVVYTLQANQCGDCEPYSIKTHWVIVDKIPSDFTVKYELEIK